MGTCTFFGHRECPEAMRPVLKQAVLRLIREEGVDTFYVGNQGRFDAMVLGVLRELEKTCPQIRYGVVLAYLPKAGAQVPPESMFPQGLETVPPRFAIAWRNDWMLSKAQWVVTYVTHSWGGAAGYAQKARKLGKDLVPLSPGQED